MKYLFITANFAPRSASPALRTVHLAKYLSQLANDIHVLTYDEKTLTLFSDADEALTREVPSTVKITRVQPGPIRRRLAKSNSDGSVRKAKGKYISNPLTQLLIPDPHMDAIPSFYRTAKDLVTTEQPDVIITFGYPYSMHFVGMMLKRRFPNLVWVADYGDPWVGTPVTEMPRPGWRRWLDKRLEKRCLRRADLVTLTTVPTQLLYETEFPFLAGKTDIVEMGYDPDNFATIKPMPRPQDLKGKTVFLHAGRVYPAARDPKPFIEAVAKIKRTAPELFPRLRVALLGETDPFVRSLIDTSGAKEAYHLVEWVPMADSIAWMKSADYLLLFGNKGGIQVPGKVYQYLGTGHPIFMTCETADDPTVGILQNAKYTEIVENNAPTIQSRLELILKRQTQLPDIEEKLQAAYFSWPKITERLNKRVKDTRRLSTKGRDSV